MFGKKNYSVENKDHGNRDARIRGTIILAIAFFIDAIIVTQYMAHVFQYHPALGFNINHFYMPWACVIWYFKWGDLYPAVFSQIGNMALCVTLVCMFFSLIVYSQLTSQLKAKADLYGSARWSNEKDIENAGLFSESPESVVVGGYQDKKGHIRYLRHSGPEHVLTFAPTRSGKGVGLVVPTMLSWSQSAVVTDLKGELWALTAGWRKKYAHNRVLKFEPAAEDSIHWNPLDEIRYGSPEVVGDVQNLATLIVDPDGKGLEDHWAKTAYALLTGVILFVLRESHRPAEMKTRKTESTVKQYQRSEGFGRGQIGLRQNDQDSSKPLEQQVGGSILANLPMVDRLLSIAKPGDLWNAMSKDECSEEEERLGCEVEHVKNFKELPKDERIRIQWLRDTKGISKIIRAAGNDMKARPEEEAGSVLSTAKSFLSLYRDPVVANNISESEFRIRDLMYHNDNPSMPDDSIFKDGNHRQAVTLYIVTQPNDKNRLRPLVRVMVNMIVRLLANKMEFEKGRPKALYDHRLLLMLDEFPSLGKLDILQESLAFISGYGLKAYLITQDINQLKSKEMGYGEDETITSNCHVQNAYAPNRIETAEHLSKMAGQTTIVKEDVSINMSQGGGLFSGLSKNKSLRESQRELITPDECMRLKLPVKDGANIIEPGEMLIFVAGYPAIRGVQPLYFKDPVYLKRAQVTTPADTDRIRLPIRRMQSETISVHDIRKRDHEVQGQSQSLGIVEAKKPMSLNDCVTTDLKEAA